MTQLINNIYENGEGPQDFSEVIVIAFKKLKATKCSNQCNINLTAHIAKIKTRIPKMKDRRKTENVLAEDQSGLTFWPRNYVFNFNTPCI